MSAARTIRAGLVGRGIGASASPAIHMREAAANDVSLVYDLVDFDVRGLDDAQLGAELDGFARRGYAGVNVTFPFKQAVMALLDEIDEIARALGAVNCIVFDKGRKLGFNSDWVGFSYLLDHELPDVSRSKVAQVGAGGAGSATAYALLATGTHELRIFDTIGDRAARLVDRLSPLFPDASLSHGKDIEAALAGANGIVQATPVGMASHSGMPFDPAMLAERQWLADIIYFPRETELVLAARQRGLRAVGGSAMVIGQASLPFERFTGCRADRERMLAHFLAADSAGGTDCEQAS